MVLGLPGRLLGYRFIRGRFHPLDRTWIRLHVGDAEGNVLCAGLNVGPEVPLGVDHTPQELNERIPGGVIHLS